MKRLSATLCVTLGVLLGSAGEGLSADRKNGLDAHKRGEYVPALGKWKTLAETGDVFARPFWVKCIEKDEALPKTIRLR
jgi:hypothetical protein